LTKKVVNFSFRCSHCSRKICSQFCSTGLCWLFLCEIFLCVTCDTSRT